MSPNASISILRRVAEGLSLAFSAIARRSELASFMMAGSLQARLRNNASGLNVAWPVRLHFSAAFCVWHLVDCGMAPTASIVQALAEYNAWQNRQVYAACAQLPDDVRRLDRGALFGSIHATLDHIVYGDRAWLNRFRGEEPPAFSGGVLIQGFDELAQARAALDDEIRAFATEVRDEWLAADFAFYSKAYGREAARPAWSLVLHMFNHQTHHRGQVTALLSQLGVDYGVTDFPWSPHWDAE